MRVGALRLLAWLFIAAWLGCGSALAERRVALVIGNSAYKSVPRLANPANDATLVGGMFKKAGFDWIDIKADLNATEMRKALRDFGGRTRDADVAVIYYAGHGIELDGTNYLIPTDATLETDSDVLDETVALDRALFAVEPAKQLRLVILDACRDNPFAKSMKRTVAARAIGRGLAKVEPTSPNTMIAFAAKAGSTASDGGSRNSPFAAAIVERLPTPGLDLRKAFGFVRDDVLKNTGYKQEPYVYGSLGGEDVSLVPTKSAATSQQPTQDAVRRDYELARQVGTREVWTAFLTQYPDGFYASLARGQLDRVAAEETRVKAAERARLAEQEKARLAADRARQAEQDKATAAAKVAEDARIAAENSKQIVEAKAAAAEQRRKEAEAAAEKAAANPDDQKAVDRQRPANSQQNVAALTPATSQPARSPEDINKLVQLGLRRVGCFTGPAEGEWSSSSQQSVLRFNKSAGTKFDDKLASLDLLEAIKARQGRICPQLCEHGFTAVDDRCVRLTCHGTEVLNEKGQCVSRTRDDGTAARKKEGTLAARPEPTTSKPTEGRSPGGNRCVSISQRCALEIGGRCDQASGKWEYGRNGAGGSTESFNACLGRLMAGRK
nr:caspase family protein [Bradyrhizobium sp. 35]